MTSRHRLHTAAASTIVAILAAIVLAADQFTKNFALEHLPYQETVVVWDGVLEWYLTRNPGAAFSLGEGVTWIFTIVLAAAAVTIVVLAVSRVHSRLWTVALGLLLGGILGNLTDRLVREPGFPVGHVIDFIHTPWMMPAIYNVADIFIVSMMISVALLVVIGLRLDGTREPKKGSETSEGESASGERASAPDEAVESEESPRSTGPAQSEPGAPRGRDV